MPITQTGDSTYPKIFSKGGQKLYTFPDHFLFILENHVYRTAGTKHWNRRFQRGEVSREGISLNKRVFAKAFGNASKDFMVYDAKKNRVFKLRDREQASRIYGKEEKGNRTLIVLPLDSFEEVEVTDEIIPKGLRQKFS